MTELTFKSVLSSVGLSVDQYLYFMDKDLMSLGDLLDVTIGFVASKAKDVKGKYLYGPYLKQLLAISRRVSPASLAKLNSKMNYYKKNIADRGFAYESVMKTPASLKAFVAALALVAKSTGTVGMRDKKDVVREVVAKQLQTCTKGGAACSVPLPAAQKRKRKSCAKGKKKRVTKKRKMN